MYRFLIVCGVFVLLFGGLVVATAQDDDLDVCTDDIETRIADALDVVSEQIREGSEDLQISLIQAQLLLESYRARCELGLVWNNENSEPGVTDPIQVPDGIYTVRLVSNESLSIDITELSGDCGDRFVFVPSDGGEEEIVSEMEECLMLMDIDAGNIMSDAPATWSVEFIPVVLTGDN